jgi:hypothetical protein
MKARTARLVLVARCAKAGTSDGKAATRDGVVRWIMSKLDVSLNAARVYVKECEMRGWIKVDMAGRLLITPAGENAIADGVEAELGLQAEGGAPEDA